MEPVLGREDERGSQGALMRLHPHQQREMDMSYEFQSMLYRTEREMHIAIAESYLSAGGNNDNETMLKFLAEMSDTDLANDAIENWELKDNPDFNTDELVAAMADIRNNFAEHFPED
jgi:hypothetical protein